MIDQQESPVRYSVEFTEEALADIRSIRDYIESELLAQKAAIRTVASILDAASSLSTLPYRNRSLSPDTAKQSVRSAKAGNYRLLYLIANTNVKIFAVLYGKRDIEGRLSSLLERIQ